jgi:catechol 2,3-dioxygenase-like lactoylglutathione lyase family enzyme
MSIEYVFAGLAVTHLEAAIDWYARLLGRPPDMLPNEREAVWRVAETASVYIVADDDRAGQSGGRDRDGAGLVPQGEDQRSGRQRDPARGAPQRSHMIEEMDCA